MSGKKTITIYNCKRRRQPNLITVTMY